MPPARLLALTRPCGRCGCPGPAHEHHRAGTDCSLCGQCRAYRPPRPRWVAALLRALTRRPD